MPRNKDGREYRDYLLYDTVDIAELIKTWQHRLFTQCDMGQGRTNVEVAGSMPRGQTFAVRSLGLGLSVGTSPAAEEALRVLLGGLILDLDVGNKNQARLCSMVFYPGGVALPPEQAFPPELLEVLDARPNWAKGGFCAFVKRGSPTNLIPHQNYCVGLQVGQAARPALKAFADTGLFNVQPTPCVQVFLAGQLYRDSL